MSKQQLHFWKKCVNCGKHTHHSEDLEDTGNVRCYTCGYERPIAEKATLDAVFPDKQLLCEPCDEHRVHSFRIISKTLRTGEWACSECNNITLGDVGIPRHVDLG